MKNVRKSVLVWHTPQEMYDLVIDAPSYPKFLTGCTSAVILESTRETMVAQLGIGIGGIEQKFTTRNEQVPGESVVINLVNGPFSYLKGKWTFTALPPTLPQTDVPHACRIYFEMDYEFSNRALGFIVGPVFDRLVNSFVDSFIKRADAVYGNGRQ